MSRFGRWCSIVVLLYGMLLMTGCGAPAEHSGNDASPAAEKDTSPFTQSGAEPTAGQGAERTAEQATDQATERGDAALRAQKADSEPAPQTQQAKPAAAAGKPQQPQTDAPRSPAAPQTNPAKTRVSGDPNAPVSSAVPNQPKAPQQAKPPTVQPEQNERQSVYISISGDEEHGVILPSTALAIEEGDTVLDVLKRVTKEHKIQMEYKGKGATGYVEGIDNLYEFDHGPKSGWLYRVNGEFPEKSAGSYKLNNGDRIEWLYTLNLGKDVGKSEDGAGDGKGADGQ